MRSFNRDAEGSAGKVLDHSDTRDRPTPTPSDRPAKESIVAIPRSPPEFAEWPSISGEFLASGLLWVAAKRID